MTDELSSAIIYATASGDETGLDLVVFQGDHPDFPASILVVTGTDDDLLLPQANNADPVVHTAAYIDFTPPGFDKDGPIDGKISIDNVSGLINEYTKLIQNPRIPISVIIRRFHINVNDYVTPTIIDEEIRGLIIRSINLTATTATGTLSYPDVREDNFPLKIYTADEYPGLVGY